MEIQRKSESGFLGTNIVSESPGFIKYTETRKEAIFSCSSPAVMNLRCCAMQVSFEISAFTRDSHLTRIVAIFHCLL